MVRNKNLIDLRPKIPAAQITQGISEIEEFQNLTLRPIIKFQNDFLVSFYSNFARGYHKDWGSMSNEKKETFIEASTNKNQNLKNTFVGSISGFFTKAELDFYFLHKSEVNRRIVQIIKQRILSNLSIL